MSIILAVILILIFFCHGFTRTITDFHSKIFFFIDNLLNSSVLIRISPCLSVAKIKIVGNIRFYIDNSK
jgi:hypothetical protein